MRHNTPYIKLDAQPECPECGAPMTFAKQVDVASDRRAHFIFRCSKCSGEAKLWRPDWQALTEEFMLIEE